MAVRIRLRRTGKRNQPCHRIVVTDARSPRDGRFIENIGTYDPRGKVERIDLERVDHWVARGAQPSETVAAIIKRARAGIPMGSGTKDVSSPPPAPAEEPAPPQEAVEESEAEPETEPEPEE